MNKQFNNVGNEGDLLKHGALVALLEKLVGRGRSIAYIDTHAFLLEAPLPQSSQWRALATAECERHPAYRRYFDLELASLRASGAYRCSGGLAIDVDRQAAVRPGLDLIFGESDARTRTTLASQLSREGVTPRALLSEAIEIGTVDTVDSNALFALVDPFTLDSTLWRDVIVHLARLAAGVTDAAVEVFTYDRSALVDWPPGHGVLSGPVAAIDRGPYHLAVYASPPFAGTAAETCERLGWRTLPAARQGASRSGASVSVTGFSALRTLTDSSLIEAVDFAAARLDDDPRASLMHQRLFLERSIRLVAQHRGLDLTPCADAAAQIRAVERELRLRHDIVALAHQIRLQGNVAVHGRPVTGEAAKEGLLRCHRFGSWLVSWLGGTESEPFGLPVPQAVALDTSVIGPLTSTRVAQHTAHVPVASQSAPVDATDPITVLASIPDPTRFKWVYFATPSRANRNDTYDLAYSDGALCTEVYNAVGATKPNVAHVAPGDIVLLAYGRGRYEPQLYLQVEPSPDEPLARTLAMTRLTGEVADRLAAAGYRLDPKLGSFTGWRVTPCGDWRGQLPAVLKPGGNNFLRRWSEVRAVNGW